MAQRDGVVCRPLCAPVLHRPIGLVTLRGRPLSLAATEMLTLLRHEMNESPGVVVPRPVSTGDGKGARKR